MTAKNQKDKQNHHIQECVAQNFWNRKLDDRKTNKTKPDPANMQLAQWNQKHPVTGKKTDNW